MMNRFDNGPQSNPQFGFRIDQSVRSGSSIQNGFNRAARIVKMVGLDFRQQGIALRDVLLSAVEFLLVTVIDLEDIISLVSVVMIWV